MNQWKRSAAWGKIAGTVKASWFYRVWAMVVWLCALWQHIMAEGLCLWMSPHLHPAIKRGHESSCALCFPCLPTVLITVLKLFKIWQWVDGRLSRPFKRGLYTKTLYFSWHCLKPSVSVFQSCWHVSTCCTAGLYNHYPPMSWQLENYYMSLPFLRGSHLWRAFWSSIANWEGQNTKCMAQRLKVHQEVEWS